MKHDRIFLNKSRVNNFILKLLLGDFVMKKIWSLFLLIILLGFCIGDIAYCACTGDPNDESEIAYETSVILEGMVTVINLYSPDIFFLGHVQIQKIVHAGVMILMAVKVLAEALRVWIPE